MPQSLHPKTTQSNCLHVHYPASVRVRSPVQENECRLIVWFWKLWSMLQVDILAIHKHNIIISVELL